VTSGSGDVRVWQSWVKGQEESLCQMTLSQSTLGQVTSDIRSVRLSDVGSSDVGSCDCIYMTSVQ